MSIFICYAHEDKEFAHKLALQLHNKQQWAWLDEWELNIGDSIVDRLQSAILGAKALLVLLSPHSVESNWCRKELNSGIILELERGVVFVLPIIIADCDIPLFLRDKKYIDFRQDADEAFSSLLVDLGRITSTKQGFIQDDFFKTDWGRYTDFTSGLLTMNFVLVSYSDEPKYTVLHEIELLGNETSTMRAKMFVDNNLEWWGDYFLINTVANGLSGSDILIVLENPVPVLKTFTLYATDAKLAYTIKIKSRRLGEDAGKVLVYDIRRVFELIRREINNRTRKPTLAEQVIIDEIVHASR